jgi:3',5'-cyclic AMP phosphodiesterase CpdA
VAIILDTKAEGTHGGELCELRRNWLATQLETHDKPIWLFMHHPPFPTGLKAMDTIGMKRSDAEALGTLVQDHRHIQHLFFGHFHRPIAGNWRNISFSSHRSMMLQCALDLETKAHVPAIHEEPQLAVILAEDGLLTVHYHDFMSDKELLSMGPADGEEHLR